MKTTIIANEIDVSQYQVASAAESEEVLTLVTNRNVLNLFRTADNLISGGSHIHFDARSITEGTGAAAREVYKIDAQQKSGNHRTVAQVFIPDDVNAHINKQAMPSTARDTEIDSLCQNIINCLRRDMIEIRSAAQGAKVGKYYIELQ